MTEEEADGPHRHFPSGDAAARSQWSRSPVRDLGVGALGERIVTDDPFPIALDPGDLRP